MFARVTKYKMKADKMAEATAKVALLKDQIMAMPGFIRFVNVGNADGSGYVIALSESREISEANAPAVAALWQQFADFLETAPSPEGFDVIADWG